MNEFLDPLRRSSSVLLLEGAPGVGKSHRWRAALTAASDAGARVLVAQPLQSEARLVGSSLLDLCAEVGDDELAGLPGPLAGALRAAVLRDAVSTGGTHAATPYAVRSAFTALLRLLVAARPLVVAVDDVQWLDPQTAEVLVFAARRLQDADVRFLLTRRVEPGAEEPAFVAELAATGALVRVSAEPLSPSELGDVIRGRFGDGLDPGLVRAAVGSADGNPLFGLEVARTLIDARWDGRSPHVPLPASLTDLVGRHVTSLPEPTRTALAFAAALGHPTKRELEILDVLDDLDPAEAAGLVRGSGHDVVFTHPLYAACAYEALPPRERRELHAHLATIVDGPEERARHLALGASGRDEQVAEALDDATRRALARGDVHAALDAARRSVEFTQPDDARLARRRTELGSLLFRDGASERARAALAQAADEARRPDDRARALHALARVVNDSEGPAPACRREQEALACEPSDPLLRAEIHMGLAVSYSSDWGVALEHADVALELLDAHADADDQVVAAALLARAGAAFYAGAGADLASCRRALELEAGSVAHPVSDRAMAVLAYLEMWTDEFADAREHLRRLLEQATEEGDEASRCYLLTLAGLLEARAGSWSVAAAYLEECQEASERSDNPWYGVIARQHLATLAAWRGDLEAPAALAADLVARGVERGDGLLEQRGRGLAGFCALSRGDWETAAAELTRYDDLFSEARAGEPALHQQAGDHVEALVATHRLDEASAALAALTPAAVRLGRTSVLADLARGRALLAAERGDEDAAVLAVDEALALHDTLHRPFDRARALLTSGQVHRRFRRRGRARRDLDAAVAELERLGAVLFAERARQERDRVGGRAAGPVLTDLTEGELQIAQLVARGLTSAEIGGTLFMSTKTVSAHLTRIYRKLDVRNRAELAAMMLAREGSADL